MASRAPYGTDVQPEFYIRLIGGKLVQVPTRHNDTPLLNSNFSSISRDKHQAKESVTDMAAVRAHRHLQDSLGRADGKRMDSVKTKRLRKMLPTINEEKHQDETEYLTFDQLLSPRKRQVIVGPGRKETLKTINENRVGFGGVHKGTKSRKRGLSDLATATSRRKWMEMSNILEPAVGPLLNRVQAVEDVLQSCTRLDEKRIGVLETSYLARVFRSFGIKLGERDLFKLAELTDSSLGNDHILYRKLCGNLVGIFSGNSDVDRINEKSTSTHTPCASVETYSPGSVEDYELPIDNINDILDHNDHSDRKIRGDSRKLPPIVTTSLQNFSQSRPRPPRPAINELPRKADIQSCSLRAPLPRIADHEVEYTTPLLKDSQQSRELHLCSSERDKQSSDGMMRLQCALESCADENGMIDLTVALRVVKNYNLIYNLHLPIDDMKTQLRLKRHHNLISMTQLMELLR